MRRRELRKKGSVIEYCSHVVPQNDRVCVATGQIVALTGPDRLAASIPQNVALHAEVNRSTSGLRELSREELAWGGPVSGSLSH